MGREGAGPQVIKPNQIKSSLLYSRVSTRPDFAKCRYSARVPKCAFAFAHRSTEKKRVAPLWSMKVISLCSPALIFPVPSRHPYRYLLLIPHVGKKNSTGFSSLKIHIVFLSLCTIYHLFNILSFATSVVTILWVHEIKMEMVAMILFMVCLGYAND